MELNENEVKINLLIVGLRKELDKLSSSFKTTTKVNDLIESYCSETGENLTILENQVVYILEMFSSQHNMMLDNFEYVLTLEEKLKKYEH